MGWALGLAAETPVSHSVLGKAPAPIHLLMQTQGSNGDGSDGCVPATLMGDLGYILASDFRFQPLPSTGHCGHLECGLGDQNSGFLPLK